MSYQSDNGGNMTGSADNHSRPGNSASFGIPPDTIPAVVIMVFVLVINSSVILLISCYSCLRTTSNIILASLAVSDFLVGFVGIPLLVTCSSALHLTSVCTSSIIFFTFMALSTVLHITVMTCDRYIYIMWALRYPEIVRRSRVFLVLATTWIISLGQSLVRLSWTWNVSVATAVEDLALVREKETIYFLFNIIVFFLIPLIVMIVLDARMLLLLRKQCQKIARENLPAEFVRREKKLQRRQRRAVLTCVLLLILYVIFWLPYFILELVQQHNTGKLPNLVIITIYYLRLCTSLFNPLTYTLRKYDLRSRVKNIFQRMFFSWRKDETGMEYTRGTNLSHGPVASV